MVKNIILVAGSPGAGKTTILKQVAGSFESKIDTHASVGENGRYLPGFPVSFLEKLGHVRGLIYIDATTKDIMEHRKVDGTRKRENDDAPTIDAQRLINISMLSFASAYLNIPFYVVINRHGDLENTVEEIKKRIKEVVGE